jgi:peptidyl-prolyl cis-trans isomerase B (cyclophilin B)
MIRKQNGHSLFTVFRNSIQLTMLASVLACAASISTAIPAFASDPVVLINTTRGPIYIRVFLSRVPNTAGSFLDLVQRGFYSGSNFHRIENWCIQGGGPGGNPNGIFVNPNGQPRRLRLEIANGLSHRGPGVVAMARTSDPNSASCQFYITKSGAPYLDGKYAIFGGVVKGMSSVFAMRQGDSIISAEVVSTGQDDQQQASTQSQSPSSYSSDRSTNSSGMGSAKPPVGPTGKPFDSGF